MWIGLCKTNEAQIIKYIFIINIHSFIIHLLDGCLDVPVQNEVQPQAFRIALVQYYQTVGDTGL